ncbi:MAG: hypothetical protein HC933_20110, partial [Pleurocapsa sp. SU_196_0]|nr:hypothetical protein [Pleurocapsa sp. SU_196_0]
MTRRTATSAGSSGSAVLSTPGVSAPGGRRTLERAPLVIQSLQPLEPGFYTGLPQVARMAVFARDERAVLITTPERVKLYRDLPVLGAGISINPGIADWNALENHVVLGIDTALEDFPSQPDAFRLELATGQKYTRDEFLDRLEALGYEREANLDASDLEKTEGYFNVIGDTLQIRVNTRGDTVRAEFFGDELETLRLNDEKVKTYSLEPLG